jgi:hypothetical protein
MNESVKNDLLREISRERTIYQELQQEDSRDESGLRARSRRPRGGRHRESGNWWGKGAIAEGRRSWEEKRSGGEHRTDRETVRRERNGHSAVMKQDIFRILLVVILTAAIPYFITTFLSGGSYRTSQTMKNINSGKEIIIKENGKNTIIDAEQYIAAVLAAEADMTETDEVLQAKAVMLRTEVYYTMGDRDIAEATEFNHTYYVEDDLKGLWSTTEYENNTTRLQEAVLATLGQTQ